MAFNIGIAGNKNIQVKERKGPFTVIEYEKDLSVTPEEAVSKYYFAKMGGHKRKLLIDTSKGVILQAGEMEIMVGDVKLSSGFKGVGDMIGKAFRGSVTGEKMTMPAYQGNGYVITEPTNKHLLLVDLSEWNGGIVVEDGAFLACEASVQQSTQMRKTVSSAVAGGEGLFNMCLKGNGCVALESDCPMEELLEIEIRDDVVRIDGNMAVAWSPSLTFTVEKAGTSIFGSAVSGEGLVNVYRGTGRILVKPNL